MNTLNLVPETLLHLQKSKCTRNLGDGGCSTVMLYKCKECHNKESNFCNEMFIVKKIHINTDNATDNDNEKYQKVINKILFNEFTIGKQLDHQNIIKTLDIDNVNKCLIFENFIGIDLLDTLNDKSRPSIVEMLKMTPQIINGLEYLHSLGIAHLDLKLENILLNKYTNQIKIIDFGHSKKFIKNDKYEYLYSVSGTENYFPPEYYRQSFYMPDKADMWALGIVLYNFVYDKMPWSNANSEYNFFETKINIKELPIKLFPEINATLTDNDTQIIYDLFLNIFNKNPTKRMSIQEFKSKFNKLSIL